MKTHLESIMIATGVVLVVFALLISAGRTRAPVEPQKRSQIHQTQKAKANAVDIRVAQLRNEIGERLNRGRIHAQYENLGESAQSSVSQSGWHPDPVLKGAPLEGERHPMQNEKPIMAIPSAETEIHNIVQAEENIQKWNTYAKAQYIAQFIARAEAMGYRVQIDQDMNVYWEYTGARSPQNADLQLPHILLAPICSL
jgi:hypothetical protein